MSPPLLPARSGVQHHGRRREGAEGPGVVGPPWLRLFGHGCLTPWPSPPLSGSGWRHSSDGAMGKTCMLICCPCKFPTVRVLILTPHPLHFTPIFDSLSAPLYSCILIPLDMIWIWVALVSRKWNADSVPVLIGFA